MSEVMIHFESDGLVIRSHGVGTILRTRPDGHGRSFSIPDLIARTGRVPHVELTGFDETATHSEAAGLLENPPDTRFLRLERIIRADGDAVARVC